MNWNNARHEATCVSSEQYPPSDLPEIILCGRSNVGKSSFINTMTNRKNLARVGQTPGKTRQIIFFNIEDKIRFVDMPGYGYAKVSKTEQESWKPLTDEYFRSNRNISLALLFMDIRRDPSFEDLMMMEWFNQNGISYMVVAVKTDKFAKSKVKFEIERLQKGLVSHYRNEIFPFSSSKKEGVEKLKSYLEERFLAL
ncbi:MAG TPA: YihA family ribosome biogenesis GTP-binding protein [Clostridiales bacterium]|nr:YihA family ribosome biogenesis GTP-binding protein [Clostridiales bacterium]